MTQWSGFDRRAQGLKCGVEGQTMAERSFFPLRFCRVCGQE